MKLRRIVRVPLALAAVTMGCADGSPTTPSSSAPPVPLITALTVTGPDAVLTGLSASYAVTAVLNDRTTRTVAPTWTSSNPDAASVDAAGRLDGRTHGMTTVTATHEGRSVSKTVQVVNNYSGTWEGRFVVRACSDAGDLTNRDGGWCRQGPGRVGRVDNILLTLVQSGNNLRDITGTLGSYSETLTGEVSPDGRLHLRGTVTERDFDYDDIILSTLRISSWDSKLEGTGMTGRWAEDFTSLVFRIGTAHRMNELVTLTRTQ